MLSPTMQALVYLEHLGEVDSKQLQKWQKNSLRGIIGKLEAQALITRSMRDKSTFYKLSDKGLKFLDDILENLHEGKEPLNRWTIVLFSIPEKERTARDRLRRFLQKSNFGNIYGSAWIATSRPGITEDISRYSKSNNIADKIVIIEGTACPNDNRKIAASAWNIQSLSIQYHQFIKKTESINKLKKEPDDASYEAKKLIFELALIVQNDPNLPPALLPNDWPKQRALEKYQEIRKRISR